MADKHTMQDHIDDLLDEVVRLRQQIRDLEALVRSLEAERDQWQQRAQST